MDDAEFGYAVTVSGDRVLVGAPGGVRDLFLNKIRFYEGRAYLFDLASGALLRTFTNPVPWRESRFGSSVSICGSHVLICGSDECVLYDAASGSRLRTFEGVGIGQIVGQATRLRTFAGGGIGQIAGKRIIIGHPGIKLEPGRVNVYEIPELEKN